MQRKNEKKTSVAYGVGEPHAAWCVRQQPYLSGSLSACEAVHAYCICLCLKYVFTLVHIHRNPKDGVFCREAIKLTPWKPGMTDF